MFKGRKEGVSYYDYERSKILLFVNGIGVIGAFLFLFIDLSTGFTYLALTNFCITLGLLIPLYFLIKNKVDLSVKTLLIFGSIYWYVFADSMPKDQGHGFFISTLIICLFTLLDSNNKGFRIFFISLLIIQSTLLIFFDLNLINYPDYPESYTNATYTFNVFVANAVNILLLVFYAKVYTYNERSLIESQRELLKNNHELRKANHELDQFIYNTSHGIRSPIKSILGVLQLSKGNETDNKLLISCLDLIRKSTYKLDKIVGNVLEIYHNKNIEEHVEMIDLNSLIDEIILEHQHLLHLDTLNIKGDSDILVDKIRMKAVLVHLINNAIQYTRKSFSEKRIDLEVKRELGKATILVKDNGNGIKDHIQPYIFDMFYRGDNKSEGAGLGLYLVRDIIEKMKGKIELESTYGQGTKFRLTFPLDEMGKINSPSIIRIPEETKV